MGRSLALVVLLGAAPAGLADEASEFAAMRRLLVEAIDKGMRQIRQQAGEPGLDRRVVEAMAKVPRHEFVPPELQRYAYLDRPLPVGPEATVSQPSLIAVMTDLVRVRRSDRVLEVGIGGGYHTAILAELSNTVFSVEYSAEVAETAKRTLDRLGYRGIEVRIADGYYGWPDRATSFDAIIVRMAVPELSPSLLAQLKPGGRLIAPVGPPDGPQELVLIEKGDDGRIKEKSIMGVRFRPLPGGLRI
ncbi:MAG: protein-L-isoaspartate(D-aspartate) O-methyltransferase [Pseudomonadota bacterium]